MRKAILFLVIALIAVVIVASLAYSPTSDDIEEGSDDIEEKTHALKYDYDYQTTDLVEAFGFNYIPEDGYIYLIVELKVVNDANTSYVLRFYHWAIIVNDTEYLPRPLNYDDAYKSVIGWGLHPGDEKTCQMWYEIPLGFQEMEMEYVGDEFGGEVLYDPSLL